MSPSNPNDALSALGWRSFFEAQSGPDSEGRPARVMAVHRGHLEVAHAAGRDRVDLSGKAEEGDVTVGDWVLLAPDTPLLKHRLDRLSLFRRRAAGTSGTVQLIAANVDTLFIVTSANRDFNVARLERYLAIAQDAGAFPVVVITKADLVDSTRPFVSEAGRLLPGLLVETLDARSAEQVEALRGWCGPGQTIALLGSSGVGKSTLVGTLTGERLETRAVREDDQRGRHTTTARSLHRLPQGGWLIDTPGMRELQLVDVGEAIEDVFAEITSLAARCRFSDCGHEAEPGCAVREAIDAGDLDEGRLRRFRKLQAEDRRNSESLAERRSRDRSLGKLYRTVQAGKRRAKGGTS